MRKYNIKNSPNNINILFDDDPMMTLTLQSYFQASSGYNVDVETILCGQSSESKAVITIFFCLISSCDRSMAVRS